METKVEQLNEEDIQDLADIVFNQLSEADRQLKKYCKIVSDYSLLPDFKYDGCTLKQAMNCAQLFGGKVSHYNTLFSKLKSLGAE